MTDERLAQLLKDADAAGPVPVIPADLAERVLARAGRRRVVRVGTWAAAAAAVLMAGVGTGIFLWHRPHAGSAGGDLVANAGLAKPDLPALRRDMALLRIQAESNARVAKMMLDIEAQQRRMAQASAALRALDPLALARAEVDQAARLVVLEADRKAQESRSAEAAGDLKRVIEVFPGSAWAQVARERLAELTRNGGEKL